MTDQELIARLLKWAEILSKEPVMTFAADRIEQLAATCEELKLELDNELQYRVSMEYLLAFNEELFSDLKKHTEQLEAKLNECEARLGKAVEEMRWALPILEEYLAHPNDIWLMDDFRVTLDELKCMQ